MLRIMRDRVSYGTTTTLSIPEVPSHAVILRLSGHLITGKGNEVLNKKIPILIGQDRLENADLDQSRPQAVPTRPFVAGRRWKERMRAILVDDRGEQPEVPAREPTRERRCNVDLTARLIPGAQKAVVVLPLYADDVGEKGAPNAPADSGESGRRRAFGNR